MACFNACCWKNIWRFSSWTFSNSINWTLASKIFEKKMGPTIEGRVFFTKTNQGMHVLICVNIYIYIFVISLLICQRLVNIFSTYMRLLMIHGCCQYMHLIISFLLWFPQINHHHGNLRELHPPMPPFPRKRGLNWPVLNQTTNCASAGRFV